MSRIAETFRRLKERNEAAFMPYVACGDPSAEFTVELANTLIQNGADLLEFGIPFSDPIADGPTIQNASVRALRAGMHPDIAFEVARKIRNQNAQIPIVVMTYYNLVMHGGVEKFVSKMKEIGLDGLIVPDLPIEESADLEKLVHEIGVDLVHLVSPRSSDARIKEITSRSSGFVYLVSVEGTTGAREKVENRALNLIKRVKEISREQIPLAMGFGISRPEHVKSIVGAGADGVIVASKIIDLYSKDPTNPKMHLAEIAEFANAMKAACKKQ
ncbi:MAG: tryptophan synthase subunit alpha [Nitrososphaerota archaeon]|nr:tryptophan synthase subunit alpha [Nitrososphaerota archaeon]